ncbi:TPA: DUF5301 domain-containing protein [Streptococcus suis]|uniref:DUF5301 domain-containing protein n=1 Tax=Streptococcus suis TaxID=1307 RepID=UPI001C9823BF|nr:DUF5301 domain-containing protein [Streptococcus suis]MBY4955344.1 DUF5301 domain-containing protein [Streptococcus suis]MBY4981003.1 DUF5301 domain-containing protein [Streptococcus suis]MBY4991709.1 DUF5301 domain-containing protein [Streptococcus suis]MBY5007111.1 DUF5301 domain-containing protein [Streptococcus suis]MBY5016474.1 DUF5301 domain-containing protein [Streptococcus suis]
MKKRWLIFVVLSCISLLLGYQFLKKTEIRFPQADQIVISNQDGGELRTLKGSEMSDFLSELSQIHPYLFKDASTNDQPVGVEEYYRLTFQPNNKIAYLYEKNGKTYLEFPYELTVRTKKSLSELID